MARLLRHQWEEEGWALPEPRAFRTHCGQFRVRLPESFHAWLAGEADTEGVSLNTYVVAKLSEAQGLSGSARAGSPLASRRRRQDEGGPTHHGPALLPM